MLRARYRRIVLFFARVLLSIAFWDIFLPRIGLRSTAERTRPDRLRRAAVSFRSLAIQMGGVLIKVGQFLSSRVDVLPPEFTDELAGLQDEVPPADFSAIRVVAESEYGVPLSEKFEAFEETPLAAASLGQVHRARIHTDTADPAGPAQENNPTTEDEYLNVVVKILRPNIEAIIDTDLAALRTVGGWLNRYRPIRRRANIPALLDEFTSILYEEIDYLAEGRNAETFAANFKDQAGVRVPHVFWTHTTRRTLTLENVWAIKITDYKDITRAGISRTDVASRLVDTYLKQIFEDGFFHADPHPGNLFVDPQLLPTFDADGQVKRAWELTFVDFGMVGTVPPNLRYGLREFLIGLGTKDASRVVKSYQMMDFLLPGADLERIEKAGTQVLDRFWGMNMTELSAINIDDVSDFTDEFRDLLYEMPFQVPQNVIFLARCVGILSGMCTGLDPEFNLFDHLAPYARRLLVEEAKSNGETLVKEWLTELEKFTRTLLLVPQKMDSVLTKVERGQIAVRTPDIVQQVKSLERAVKQVAGGLIFTALLLGGIQLYLGDQGPFGVILLSGAGLSLLWILLAGRWGNGR